MRSFKARTVLASVLGILAMLVAACGTSSTAPKPNPGNGYDYSYTYGNPGKTGGAIVFEEYQTPDTLSPLLASAEIDVKNINAILDGCVVQLPDLTLGDNGWKPDQCKEVPTVANGDESADGMSTTVKLDPSMKWSDGQPITVDDYLFTIDQILDPNYLGAYSPYDKIKQVDRVDDSTFKIEWKQAYGPYLATLWSPFPAHEFPTAWDMTTHTYKGVNAALQGDVKYNFEYAGNGPFTLQSHSANTYVYKKNPNFHSNFFHAPQYDELIFKSTGDVNTSIETFKTGQADQADDYIVTNIASFTGIDPKQQIVSPDLSYEHIDFNLRDQALNAQAANDPGNKTPGHSIFAQQLVRKAFIESFNLCLAFQAILNQSCTDPNLFTAENTAPPSGDFDPTVTLPKYDAAAGKADLASAGYANCQGSDGHPLTFHIATTAGNATRLAFISLAAQQWNLNLGCKVKVDTIPADVYFGAFTSGGTLETGAFDIALFAYIDGTECSTNLTTFQSTNIPTTANPGGGNDSGINDPQLDTLINQALGTVVTKDRIAVCKAAQKEFTQQMYNMPLYIRANIALVSPNLGNYKQNPGSVGNTWNVGEWWSNSPRATQ